MPNHLSLRTGWRRAGVALALAGCAVAAQAVTTQSVSFSVLATSGPLVGSLGSGVITFDGDLVAASGPSTLTPGAAGGGLTIAFSTTIAALPGNFSETSDAFYTPGLAPTLDFLDGALVGLNYLVQPLGSTAGFAFASSITSIGDLFLTVPFAGGTSFGYFTGSSYGEGIVSYAAPVPEPSTLALSMLGLAALAVVMRRRAGGGAAATGPDGR